MSEATTTDLPGLDLVKLGPWFAEHVDGAGSALTAEFISGGKSNLTYGLSDGTHRWILRRPPMGHVLATAHDMKREYTVITALRDTPVAVPITYAFTDDDSVLGAPFYVMERAEGVPYRTAEQLIPLGPERTRAISVELIDMLGELHLVDPAEVGLANFGKAEGYLERQVHRWKKQLDASYSRDLPAADELYALLAARVGGVRPSAPGIVHGDYRLDNVLVDSDDVLTAVLDWEMSTLGDPLTDLAMMNIYRRLADAGSRGTVADATSAPGYLSEDEEHERYAAKSGRDLGDFGFYLGLAAFKLAGILEGIHYRYIHGQTVGPGFDTVGEGIFPLLELGLSALKETNN